MRCLLGVLFLLAAASVESQEPDPAAAQSKPLNDALMLFAADSKRQQALKRIRRRDSTDMVAPMIIALRYLEPEARSEVVAVLQRVAKRRRAGDDWFEWMLWQQSRSDIKPFADFDAFQSLLFLLIFVPFPYIHPCTIENQKDIILL